uniref:S phase cyclin A-associated protein in the endoplasmic reticulum isoform X1 n=2 Tax=Myxine glutinosa TaxID=7769 RepID=UPI00358E2B04
MFKEGRNDGRRRRQMAQLQRSNCQDKVRQIVAEEGRAARNLITWSVPLESREEETGKSSLKRNKSLRVLHQARGTDPKATHKHSNAQRKPPIRSTEKSPSKLRVPRKADLRARYWAYLFENLRRAVDEIYMTCETDESVVECKEVLMIFDNYVHDFKALIDWLQLQKKLENTDKHNRPTALAWEVRKMSPGRPMGPSPPPDRLSGPSSKRMLTYAAPSKATPCNATSWADRVRSCQPIPQGQSSVQVKGEINARPTTVICSAGEREEGTDGWETVHRGRTVRPRSAAAALAKNSASSPLLTKPGHRASVAVTITKAVNLKPPMQSVALPLKSKISLRSSESESQKVMEETEKLENGETHSEHPADGNQLGTELVTEPEAHLTGQTPKEIQERQGGDVSTSQEHKEECKLRKEQLSTIMESPDMQPSIVEVLEAEEELARRLEWENEEAIATAIAEEEQLTRQIQDAQELGSILEMDSKSDTAADAMRLAAGVTQSADCPVNNIEWGDIITEYDERETWRQSTSWGDMVDDETPRPPGHAIQMHEKLSSPSRKSCFSKKKHEEKQLKAQQLREKLREEKAQKLQKLMERVKEVNKWKEELLEQKRRMMEEKQLRAEYKRELQIQAIVKKAQEEDAKVNEIAFINTLEAQNRRHDALCKLQEYELRLNELQDERQRRQVEKQARDEAVQERKRALEAERLARVEEIVLKRKEHEARVDAQRQEKEKAREDAARERAREREERLAALNAAQQEAMEELQKKIQLKHDESVRRHLEQIEQRKEKAAELSSGRHSSTENPPRLTPYERKKECTICSVTISSEIYLLSHIRGRKHQQAVREQGNVHGRELSDEEVEHLSLRKYVVDVLGEPAAPPNLIQKEEEKQKAKRKAKKLRARMNSKAKEFEAAQVDKNQGPESVYKAKLHRLVKDLNRQLQSQESGSLLNSKVLTVDRTIGEISRILEKQVHADQLTFRLSGGLVALGQLLQTFGTVGGTTSSVKIPVKTLCATAATFRLACQGCQENCHYVLLSNRIALLVELLLQHLDAFVASGDDTTCSGISKHLLGGIAPGLLQTCTTVLVNLSTGLSSPSNSKSFAENGTTDSGNHTAKLSDRELLLNRITDFIRYVMNLGMLEKLCSCLRLVQTSIDDQPHLVTFLQHAILFTHSLCALARLVNTRSGNASDITGLGVVLQSSEAIGVLNLLYCTLLHGRTAGPEDPPAFAEPPLQLALLGIRLLNNFALLDLAAFQAVVGAEGLTLAFRHIASSLLWHCSQQSSNPLLHEVIICVGYFTITHPDNQLMVQSGRQPTVLQQLCMLPFHYFSNLGLRRILLPTLIAAAFRNPLNRGILEQELSCSLLCTFLQDAMQVGSEASDSISGLPPDSKEAEKDATTLSGRFPREYWSEALLFFCKPMGEE